MTPSSVLVLFVSGWGADTPSLFHLAATYPLTMLQAPAEGGLSAVYTQAGLVAGKPLAALLAQKHMADIRIADPDRFGLLTQSFDGGSRFDQPLRRDIYTSFPPGMTMADAYESSLSLQKKQVLSAINEPKSQVVFASFSLSWSLSLLRDATLTRQAVESVSNVIEQIVESALEAGIPTLICSDTASLAGVGVTQTLLPCVLVHERVEGLRGTGADRADSRELPRQAAGRLDQLAATVAALIGELPVDAAKPLFASLLKRLRV